MYFLPPTDIVMALLSQRVAEVRTGFKKVMETMKNTQTETKTTNRLQRNKAKA